jgi:NAD(P)-dependent dehydrogenase (short-subunit alcohol dehydrogenase family)
LTRARSIADLSSLAGRTALVTGGTGHIGRVISDALTELGATVSVTDVSAESCAAAVRDGWAASGFAADLLDGAATRAVVSRVLDQYGRLDILVHCAAYVGSSQRAGWAVAFPDQTSEAWRDAMQVNLTSAFELSQEAAPHLASSGHGSIVFISSIYGMVGPNNSLYEGTSMANPAAYGASKGGLLQLTRYLATTLAPSVRVNAISPGGVWRNQQKEFVDRYVAQTPLGRMAKEEDFMGAIAFLASDLSSYVTGQNLVIDGGWTTW